MTIPGAEQFEDRLKTIIHSVLTGPDQADQKPEVGKLSAGPQQGSSGQQTLQQLHVSSPPLGQGPQGGGPPGGGPHSKPMFSPVKKELPTGLPPPPSGVGGPAADLAMRGGAGQAVPKSEIPGTTFDNCLREFGVTQ